MIAIEQVEKKLDGFGSKVIEKLDSVSKRMEESLKNDLPIKANMHANYHRWIVESNFGVSCCVFLCVYCIVCDFCTFLMIFHNSWDV